MLQGDRSHRVPYRDIGCCFDEVEITARSRVGDLKVLGGVLQVVASSLNACSSIKTILSYETSRKI